MLLTPTFSHHQGIILDRNQGPITIEYDLDGTGTEMTWWRPCHTFALLLNAARRLYSQQVVDASQFVATIVRAAQDHFLDEHGLCIDSRIAPYVHINSEHHAQPEPIINLGYQRWTGIPLYIPE